MKIFKHIPIIIFFLLVSQNITADSQRKLSSYQKYINQYKELAIEQQHRYKIPSSITLAQGLLESGAGRSKLALKSNNHFGIKCHSDWKGKRVYHDDDLRGECFRKYKKVEDSYEDHSKFLCRPRYSSLFRLNITNYKGWAKGLQKCGYATDRSYANKLIKVIEDYELYKFDTSKKSRREKEKEAEATPIIRRTVYKTHGLLYVYAKENDNFERIAHDTGFKARHLRKYNEVPDDFPLQEGDIIYLEKKKKKADKPYYDHVVEAGESMYSISQKYGIQVKSLYKLNKKDYDYVPNDGDVLRLR